MTRRPIILNRFCSHPQDDRRRSQRRGGPIRCGDIVVVNFQSRVRWANGERAIDGYRILVTRRHRYLPYFRGELISRPNPLLFTPAQLRIGQPIIFQPNHVLLIFDKPKPSHRRK